SYEMKRSRSAGPLPGGRKHLVMTGTELLAKLTPLIPPSWSNLTRFHGVFAPASALRPLVVPRVEEPRRKRPKNPPPDITGTFLDKCRSGGEQRSRREDFAIGPRA